MKVFRTLVLMAVVVVAATGALAEHRVGGGVRYHASLTALTGEFDEDGLSWLVSYQYVPGGLFKLEVDLEMLPSSLTGADTVWMPQVYALLGSGLYAGLGIAMPDFDDTVYAIRAGFDIEIIGDTLRLDLNANYMFSDFDQLEELDADFITLALMARTTF